MGNLTKVRKPLGTQTDGSKKKSDTTVQVGERYLYFFSEKLNTSSAVREREGGKQGVSHIWTVVTLLLVLGLRHVLCARAVQYMTEIKIWRGISKCIVEKHVTAVRGYPQAGPSPRRPPG